MTGVLSPQALKQAVLVPQSINFILSFLVQYQPQTQIYFIHTWEWYLSHVNFVCPHSSRANRDHTELLSQSDSLLVMPHHLTVYRKNTVMFSNFRFGKFKERSIKFVLGVQRRVLSTSLSTKGCLYIIHACISAWMQGWSYKMSFKN